MSQIHGLKKTVGRISHNQLHMSITSLQVSRPCHRALDLKIGTCVARCRFSTSCSALSQISTLRVCVQCMWQHEGKKCGPSITDADEVWLRRKVKRISKIQKIARCIMLGQIYKTGKLRSLHSKGFQCQYGKEYTFFIVY